MLRELSRDIAAALGRYAVGRLLDVGCGAKPYKRFGTHTLEWIGLDAATNPDADEHGRAESMPFEDESFDTVLCTQVLEHVPEPNEVMRECARVLRKNGIAIFSVPQYWETHEIPHDYYRFTSYGMRYLVESNGLSVVETRLQATGLKVAGQAFNLAVQRWGEDLAVGKNVVVRALKMPLYALVNLSSLVGGYVMSSDRDALNIMIVARKFN